MRGARCPKKKWTQGVVRREQPPKERHKDLRWSSLALDSMAESNAPLRCSVRSKKLSKLTSSRKLHLQTASERQTSWQSKKAAKWLRCSGPSSPHAARAGCSSQQFAGIE
eukprot:904215-Amphidinium_carterae.1